MLHSIFWAICGILIILWFVGLIFRVGRGFIHILLAVAIVLLLVNVFSLALGAF